MPYFKGKSSCPQKDDFLSASAISDSSKCERTIGENYRRELTVLLSNIITEKARKINGFKEYGNQEGHSISNPYPSAAWVHLLNFRLNYNILFFIVCQEIINNLIFLSYYIMLNRKTRGVKFGF